MKKLVAAFLSMAMLVSMLAGCGAASSDTQDTQDSTAQSTAGTGDVPVLKVTFPTLYNVPSTERQQEVSGVINDYLDENGYEFHVSLEIVGPGDYATQSAMALAAGEEIDVFMPFDGTANAVPNMVSNGYLLELDEYLDEELKDTLAILELQKLLPFGRSGGKTYAIPAAKGFTLAYCFLYNKDIAEELGIDMSQVDSLEDLGGIFEQVKAGRPDVTPVGTVGSTTVGLEIGMKTDRYYQVMDVTSGVTLVGDSTKAENYYASEAFEAAVNLAYEWAQAGYTNPDNSSNSEVNAIEENMFYNGQIFSIFGLYSTTPENIEKTMTASYGRTIGCIPLGSTCNVSMVPGWSIAYTTQHPSESAQFLNLMFTDEFVLNTMFYGIEGKDYVWETDEMVAYPDGVNMTTMEYGLGTNNGMYGNQFITWPHKDGVQPDDLDYMKELMANAVFSPAYDFVFDNSNVATNLTAISNTIAQYRDALCYGDVDPAEYLPQFLSALEAAKIDDVIAEAQTQLDAFMAEK